MTSFDTAAGNRWLREAATALCISLAATACSQKPTLESATATDVSVVPALASPQLTDLYTTQRDPRFGPGDTMAVSVLGAQDLSGDRVVDGSGSIDFPLIGRVPVLGLTAGETASALQDRLSQRYLRNPQVSVIPKAMVSQQVTVMGGVTQPGRYVIDGRTTLRDALAQARGIGEYGAEKDIVVFRTVEGQKLAARFDLREINGGRMTDPVLFPNDQIVVASMRNRQLLRDLAPLVPLAGIFYQII